MSFLFLLADLCLYAAAAAAAMPSKCSSFVYRVVCKIGVGVFTVSRLFIDPPVIQNEQIHQ